MYTDSKKISIHPLTFEEWRNQMNNLSEMILEKINTKLIFEVSREHQKQVEMMEELIYDNNL